MKKVTNSSSRVDEKEGANGELGAKMDVCHKSYAVPRSVTVSFSITQAAPDTERRTDNKSESQIGGRNGDAND